MSRSGRAGRPVAGPEPTIQVQRRVSLGLASHGASLGLGSHVLSTGPAPGRDAAAHHRDAGPGRASDGHGDSKARRTLFMWRGRRTSSELRVIMMPGGSGPGAAAPATTVTVGRAGPGPSRDGEPHARARVTVASFAPGRPNANVLTPTVTVTVTAHDTVTAASLFKYYHGTPPQPTLGP